MRLSTFHLLPATLLLTLSTALQLPDFLDFFPAVSNDTVQQENHDLLKRAGNCPDGFNSCSGVGAPQLCCASHAICTADAVNVVACCPSGAACTGTIGGLLTQGTVNSNGQLIGGGAVATATTSNYGGGVATASSTTSFQYLGTSSTTTPGYTVVSAATNSNGFIVAGSSVVATPAAGVRRAEVPLFVQAIVRVVQYLPV